MIEEIVVDTADPFRHGLTELALRFRVESYVFHSFGDPTPESPIAEANAIFHWEKASDWCGEYLSAALQSASMWADFHAPLSFDPQARVLIRPRPLQGLARSVLEAASQAVWVMTAETPVDLAQRHLRLMHTDLLEQRKAYRLQGERIDAAQRQLDTFKDRIGRSAVDTAVVLKDINYLTMIRAAAAALNALGKQIDADEAEYVWRLASGSTHGKRWAMFELNNVQNLEEYEPGQVRVSRTTRLDVAYRALALSYEIAQFGVAIYGARAGHDYLEAQRRAVLEVAKEIPVDPEREVERQEVVARLSGRQPS